MIKKEILIGFVVAFIVMAFGFYLYVELISSYSFNETVKILNERKLYGKVLGLSAIPNLFVFFIYLKKKQDYRARGVLLASFFMALVILVSQFF